MALHVGLWDRLRLRYRSHHPVVKNPESEGGACPRETIALFVNLETKLTKVPELAGRPHRRQGKVK